MTAALVVSSRAQRGIGPLSAAIPRRWLGITAFMTPWLPTLLIASSAGVTMPLFGQSERTRGDVLLELERAKAALDQKPGDASAAQRHARLLYESGEFWRAREVLERLGASESLSDDALELSAKLEFLTGRYERADSLYDRLIAARAGNTSKQVMAKVGKLFGLNQRNRYDLIKTLEFPAGVVLPNVSLAKAFDSNPYRL